MTNEMLSYTGEKLRDALAELSRWTIEIVKRSDQPKGFVVLPERWIVEGSFAWLDVAVALRRTSRQQSRHPTRG